MSRSALSPPAVVGDLVSYRIRLLQIAAYKSFESVLREFGPTPRYLGLLGLISTNPGAAQSRLAEDLHLDRSSLVAILDMLEAEGLVERRRSASDRRVRRIFLTEAGSDVLARLEPHVVHHEAELTAGLTDDERATLLEMLDRIGDNLRRARHQHETEVAAE